jgi:glycosyltransferase involved in cell wall biosynthesis
MKILFLSNLYPPNVVGGYERLCFEVVSGLAARGHQVHVLTSDYGNEVKDYPGQVVERSLKIFAATGDIYHPFSCTPEQRLAMNTHNIGTLKRVVAEFEPHVIFVWNLYFYDLPLLEAIKQITRPIAYLLTDNWLIFALNAPFTQNYFVRRVFDKPSTVKRLYLSTKRWLIRLIKLDFQLPGHAIFASRFMRDLYAEANLHFDSQTVIYHGVNLSQHHEKDFICRTQPLHAGEIKLLIAGRIVEIKGIHTAIEALALIICGLPDTKIKLTVQGDDRDRLYMERLQARIAELGLQNTVEFAKPVAEDELFYLFQNYDIYLFPSLYEPFSLTLIHALAAGIPTVASNVGGNVEIIRHMQTGMLFPSANIQEFAEAVMKLSTNGSLRQAISERARLAAQHYTFENMLSEVEQLLKRIQ